MTTLLLILIAVLSYVIGSVNGAILVSRYVFRKDVRDYGSGNAGLTNFYRVFGPGKLALVVIVDVVKSVVAILLGKWLLHFVGASMVGGIFAGFCLMLGHIYPVFHGFKGGKGVLCGCVVTFMVHWWIGLICLAVFAVVVLLTRYVSLGSMCGAIVFAPLAWLSGAGGLEGLLCLFCALLLIFAHRSNIQRLLRHEESRFELKNPGKRIES